MNDVLEGYAAAATPSLIARFDSLVSSDVYAPVIDLLPAAPVRVADIGAGTGRDAAWFARQGHRVLAVEPVKELREAGVAIHGSTSIACLDDRLPQLTRTQMHGLFDLVTICAVWQHLDDPARSAAILSLGKITAHRGILIMSLRHGPGAPERRVFPMSPEDTIGSARQSGFELTRRITADSIQAANQASGVRWTWLAFKKVG